MQEDTKEQDTVPGKAQALPDTGLIPDQILIGMWTCKETDSP